MSLEHAFPSERVSPGRLAASVLLVEDDPRLAAMIADYLRTQGYQVMLESRGDVAVGRILREAPDAVLLDVNLPGLDGFTVCRAIRPTYAGAVIMLTARGDETDEVRGLESGADDYITKPLRPRSLLKRLKLHVERTAANHNRVVDPIVLGPLTVDPGRRSVDLEGKPVSLTTAEFDLLQFLVEHAGKIVSRQEIHQHIHGCPYDGLDRSIDLRVSRLRKKLDDDPTDPRFIKSVRGVGYLAPLAP